jgi:hypothetical protein
MAKPPDLTLAELEICALRAHPGRKDHLSPMISAREKSVNWMSALS